MGIPMQIKIYRGTHQIGGCITEIRTQSSRIIIDIGEELPSSTQSAHSKIEIEGVTMGAPDCNAVLITHYHGDHAGSFRQVLPQIPVYIGTASKQIYCAVQGALRRKLQKGDPERVQGFKEYSAAQPLYFGNIKVTPYSTDHSAFDSYMLLIEAEGKRILHTSDFRMHGAKGSKMPAVLEKYCKHIDVLITEGTMLSRQTEKLITERDLGKQAVKLLQKNKYVFSICSSTNIDTIAQFYSAAIKTHKPFIVCEKDFQQAILDIVTKSSRSPFYDFSRHKVYAYGKNLHSLMQEKGFFFLGRTNYATKCAMEAFPKSLLIYSMWSGYLNKAHPAFDEYKSRFIEEALNNGCKIIHLHTSGHADLSQIETVCRITQAKTIIPIHTENPDALNNADIIGNLIILQDGESFTL